MKFLPDGFEKLVTEKPYWKMSEMKEGDNKIRIVSKPIAGWLDWKDKKPYRYTPENKPKKPFDPEKPIKAFWICHVWDYARENLYVLEITQMGVLKALKNLATDEDWGDFLEYDLKIKKEGTGKETKYTVTALPHKPLTEKIKEAIATNPIRLENLYQGGDPWDVDAETSTSAVPTGMDALREILAADGIDDSQLSAYVFELAEKKKQPVDVVIESALLPAVLGKFKAHYLKFIDKDPSKAIAV